MTDLMHRQPDADTERLCPACDARERRPAFVVDGYDHVTCEKCGSLYVTPLPPQSAFEATYLDPTYHLTAEQGGARLGPVALKRARVLVGLGATRVVEVGCGPGHFLAAARQVGLAVEGVDRAKTAVRAGERGAPVHATWLSDFNPGPRFDALALWEVLEHLPDPFAALMHMRTWLEDGALLALSTPSFSGLPARLLGSKFPLVSPPDHLELFTRQGLMALLGRAGFAPIRWTSFSNLGRRELSRGLQRFVFGRSAVGRVAAEVLARGLVRPSRWVDRLGYGTSYEIYARMLSRG